MIVDGKELIVKMKGKIYHCAMDVTMDFIGGKWKTVILWYLRNGNKRFSELKRHIPAITEKMLTLQLRELEKKGIVKRKIYPEVPPRVEYFLTEEGKTMIPMLQEIAAWGRRKSTNDGVVVELVREKKKTTSVK
jgi:DNA-binding HxlR family transcriptional regulator